MSVGETAGENASNYILCAANHFEGVGDSQREPGRLKHPLARANGRRTAVCLFFCARRERYDSREANDSEQRENELPHSALAAGAVHQFHTLLFG